MALNKESSMKKPLLIAATAAMLFAGAAASAQPYSGPYGDRDRDGVPNYVERGHDRDRDGRPDDRDRYDNRRYDDGGRYDRGYDRGYGHAYGHRHWRRGERFEGYRSHNYIVSDYRRYGWRPPPRGYAYYRTDSGDVVMAALATGIIASIIANGDGY
jgi:Ni/Co efflux regulator RcnB